MSKKTVTPKLRFPEFVESGEWKSESLGDVYSFQSTNSFSRDQLNYENGLVKNIHYGDIHTKFATLFDITKENVPFINSLESFTKIALESYCVEGDIVFADASEDIEDVGKSIELVYLNNEKLLAGMHTLLARQKENKIVVGLGGYLFKSNRIRSQIKKEAQGAKVYGISANRLLNIDICFPADKKEQQKIADCLSALDELLAAERARLEALKAYKKGLLQNLFPAEGESLPALRFPEFQDGWEKKSLGMAVTFYNGRAYKQEELLEQGKYKVLRVGNFFTNNNWYYSDLELDETKYCEYGDLLYAWSASFGPRIWQGEKVIYHYHIWKVIAENNVNKDFLYLVLDFETEKIKNQSANGLGLLHITKGTIENWDCMFPKSPAEQQKIAEALTSIDEAITAQGQRVAGLAVHKKGLLQGLFPSAGETSEVSKTSEV